MPLNRIVSVTITVLYLFDLSHQPHTPGFASYLKQRELMTYLLLNAFSSA